MEHKIKATDIIIVKASDGEAAFVWADFLEFVKTHGISKGQLDGKTRLSGVAQFEFVTE